MLGLVSLTAPNAGPSRAAKRLRRVVIATQDGQIGARNSIATVANDPALTFFLTQVVL